MNRGFATTRRPHAFTLIEVMAVVALIGLLAAATAWTMASQKQAADRSEVIDRLAYADQHARRAARQLGPSVLCIDLDGQRVWVRRPGERGDQMQAGHRVQMPRGYRIDEVAWIDTSPSTRRNQRRTRTESRGLVELPVSSAGHSRTYVIKLTGPRNELDNAINTQHNDTQSTWLLFGGLTGQVTIEDGQEGINSMLSALAVARPDAD